MRVTLFMAMSANGMIAGKNGSEDFLSDENWTFFTSLAAEYGNVIFGRKTYDAIRNWNEDYGLADLADIEVVVLSRGDADTTDKNVTMTESPAEALETLERKGFKKALLSGGAEVNSAFAEAGLLDEIILNVEPVIVGSGIPLFAGKDFDIDLAPRSFEQNGGMLTLRYDVMK